MGENNQPLVLKWAWHRFSLEVSQYDSVDEAVDAAGYASDAGDEALDCIEVFDGDGHRVIPGDEALDLAHERSQSRRERNEPAPVVATVRVRHPEKGDAVVLPYTDTGRAQQDYERMVARLGESRVTISGPPGRDG
jgi:hypothetical protein